MHEHNIEQDAVVRKEDVDHMIEEGKKHFRAMQKYADEGDWTWKIAGCISGVSIVLTMFLSFFSHLTSFSLTSAIIDLYFIAFGICFAILEYKEKLLTQGYLNTLRREALFLYRPYGPIFPWKIILCLDLYDMDRLVSISFTYYS